MRSTQVASKILLESGNQKMGMSSSELLGSIETLVIVPSATSFGLTKLSSITVCRK